MHLIVSTSLYMPNLSGKKMHGRVVGKNTLAYFCIKIINYGGSGVGSGSPGIILASSHDRL